MFAAMKKWLSSIFFSLVLLPAISHAGNVSLQKCASVYARPGLHVMNDDTHEDLSRPAIETPGPAVAHTITNRPVSQNTNRFRDDKDSQPVVHAPYLLPAFFLPVEMFGNNRLSCNYPSHNFW